MNIINDIVLNFCNMDEECSSFEWRKDDSFFMIEQIPVLKIPSFQMENILHTKFQVPVDFFQDIKEKTVLSNGEKISALLISDSIRVLGYLFQPDGIVHKISSLWLDEEEAVLEEISSYDFENLSYEILSSITPNYFLTRKEKEIQKYLLETLDSLYQRQKYDEIDYLYKEIFTDTISVHKEYLSLKEELIHHFDSRYYSLYDILMLAK